MMPREERKDAFKRSRKAEHNNALRMVELYGKRHDLV